MPNTTNPHTQSLSSSNTADRGDNSQSGQSADSGEQVPHTPAANQSGQPANSGEQVLHTPAADSPEMEAPATDSTEMDPLVADSFKETSQNSSGEKKQVTAPYQPLNYNPYLLKIHPYMKRMNKEQAITKGKLVVLHAQIYIP
ncbi:hypothetical protein V6N11_022584 [Hibiscus sabdariffa]|uniref:Uncharacterized protein n=1 Tax=Hibiscus sabdariffa TaxID=183260 RepID=A0ABR2TJZ4_9ROSI